MRGTAVLVVGAGLAGFAAAWRLARFGCRVTLLEASPRVGGRLAGERVEGCALEPAPVVLSAGDTRLLAWIDEVGARDELLPTKPVVTAYAAAGTVRDVEIRSLADVRRIPGLRPWHALRLLRLPRLLERCGAACEFGAAAAAFRADDRSVAEFGRLYFGASVVRRWMASAVEAHALQDAGEASRVQFLQSYRAHAHGRSGLLRGALSEALERAARGAEVVTGCRVAALERASGGGVRAVAEDGRSFAGEAAVVATPAPTALRLADALLTTPERRFLQGVRYTPSLGVAAVLCRPPAARPRQILVSDGTGSPVGVALVEPGFRGGRAPASRGLAHLRASARFAARHPDVPNEALEKELLAGFEELWPAAARSIELTRVFRHLHGAPRFDVGHYRQLARFRRVQADRLAGGRRVAFAGDYLVHPSWEGALRSGEWAAAALRGVGGRP